MYTLDTNVLIYYGAGESAAKKFVVSSLNNQTRLYIPTITLTELFGYPKLTTQDNSTFLKLIQQVHLVTLTYSVAMRAAELRRTTNIKVIDSIIAATALITHTALVTRNIRDFKRVSGLKLVTI